MSSSAGIDERISRARLGSSVCRRHHQKTAFARLIRDIPRRLPGISRSRALTPPSMALLVPGGGPSAAGAGSRWVKSAPWLTRRERGTSPS